VSEYNWKTLLLALTVAMQPNEDQVQGLLGFEALTARRAGSAEYCLIVSDVFEEPAVSIFLLFGVKWNRVHYY
jgi:hypothetical protein